MSSARQQKLGVLAACTIGNIVSKTPAVQAVFGTFLVPLSEAFGWPRAAISVVLTIMALTAAVIYPLAGRVADTRGARSILIPSLFVYAVAVASLALMDGTLWQFYAVFFVIGSFGSIASTPIYSKVVAEWFDRGRGTALGISAGLGNGLGAVFFPVIAAIVVSQYGWRTGYAVIGTLVLLIGLPTMLALLRDAPRSAPAATGEATASVSGMGLREALGRPHFWLIIVAVASGGGATTAIFSHVVPILTDRGYGIDVATTVLSIFALTTSAAQILCGRLMDRFQTPRIVIPTVAMAIVGLILLEFGTGLATLALAGLLLGIGMGSQYGALPYFISRYFGMRAFGAIIGTMYSAVIAMQGITPVLLDHAYDVQGTYRFAVLAACTALAGATALLLLLPGYPDRAEAAPVMPDADPAVATA
ncbi:MFS family permease [Sphingobium xanthum]|uniref:MFS transporter n=1 Tax=Sphingobium xanthum TaxID=1387165 RepID=UPI001C8B9573|nr:MFS transporter [Sphingobium xanthum]